MSFQKYVSNHHVLSGKGSIVLERVSTEQYPIHHVICWCDGSSYDRMTVNVLMPTGVGKNFTFWVVEDAAELEITCNIRISKKRRKS